MFLIVTFDIFEDLKRQLKGNIHHIKLRAVCLLLISFANELILCIFGVAHNLRKVQVFSSVLELLFLGRSFPELLFPQDDGRRKTEVRSSSTFSLSYVFGVWRMLQGVPDSN